MKYLKDINVLVLGLLLIQEPGAGHRHQIILGDFLGIVQPQLRHVAVDFVHQQAYRMRHAGGTGTRCGAQERAADETKIRTQRERF